ncbi:TIGR03086 family metal-binding protein [Streptomyces avermitilis]|uniref:TIGR03086 family metal-binding protein n=1 Tax=Streptomyces avermitilis TaxID=33903 RepID=UPI0033ADC9F8
MSTTPVGPVNPVGLADQLGRAARVLRAHLGEADLAGKCELPTPCVEFDVHRLCEHLFGVLTMSGCAAAKEPLPADLPTALTEVPWVAFPPVLDRLGAAWAAPGAWEGETAYGSSTYPAPVAGMITIMELTVHGWDLATATGQSCTADDDVVATAAAIAAQLSEGARTNGFFGPETDAPADATPLERLLAFTGRKVP